MRRRNCVVVIELALPRGAQARLRAKEIIDVVGLAPMSDRRASELIVAGLAASFPDDPVISEELMRSGYGAGSLD